MSWHVPKLDLNSARWMPKLVSYAALTSQSLRATIGPLQDNWSLFHYVIGILGILPYNRNVTLQAFKLFSAYARLYNAATSPASRLRLAGSLAIIWNLLKSCRIVNQVTTTVVSQVNIEIPKVGKSCLTHERYVQLTTELTQHILAT